MWLVSLAWPIVEVVGALAGDTGPARLTSCPTRFSNTSRVGRISKQLVLGLPALRRALVTLVVIGGVWLLFEDVIDDARLFLDYLKVLVWPLVAVAFLSYFRAPLEDRFRHLSRFEALGAAAEFSAAQGRRLQNDLESDVDSLLGGIGQPGDDQGLDDPDDHEPDPDPDPAQPSTEGESQNPSTSPAPESEVGAGTGGDGELATVVLEELIKLAEAFGVPKAVVDRALARSPGDLAAQRESVRKILRNEADRSRHLRYQAEQRPRETRESIEAVIRKSASWGYDMGKAGAPKAVPDVEWNADGTWQITTEVPAVNPAARQPEPPRSIDTRQIRATDRHRQIKAFEDEIKDLERKRHSPFGGSGLSAFVNDNWLEELKSRLRSIDPTNPWAH